MRIPILLLVVCLTVASAPARATLAAAGDEARSQPRLPDVSEGWKFKTGDDRSWSDPGLDDSDWQSIRTGLSWEEQGFEDYDGYAWYRLRLRLPEALRDDPDLRRYGALRLALGKIDDVDETWLNGVRIGATGAFPDSYETAWQRTRRYEMPLSAIRWGADNVLAIRVYDDDGPGGLYEGKCRLVAPSLGDFIWFDFDLGERGDGIFVAPGGMTIAVTIENRSPITAAGEVRWSVADDEGARLAADTVAATISARGEARFTCPFAPKTPGFYRVTCALRTVAEGTVKSWRMILGYRPDEIRSPLTRQEDFDEFWRTTLTALAAVSPQYKMTRHAEMDSETHEVYEVEMRSLGQVRVRGWYEKPLAQGTYPALLRVPGYTSSMRPSGSREPLAIFSFNIRAHGNSQDDVSGSPEDYWIRGLDDPEGYFYQGAYADCVRAVDFLASRPEVDARRIAVTGGSQGGGLTLATAALDRRISLCAPDIPFLCDWVKYFKASDWPEMNAWVKAKPHRSWEKTLRTLGYFDALNFAERIRCPVLLGLGLQDEVCPAATIFAVYNRLAGPKEYRVYPRASHWVDRSHHEVRRGWIAERFGISPSGE